MAEKYMTLWRDSIRVWYPDYETQTYFVPPVIITRMAFEEIRVGGQAALVPEGQAHQDGNGSSRPLHVKCLRVQESDTRDDLALQQILFCLRKLADEQQEPMFVMSQLKFSCYLGNPRYEAATKLFLRPKDLTEKLKQGDFDILIIHRHYGILIAEVKSVKPDKQQLRVILRRIRTSIEQLDKCQEVFQKLIMDRHITPKPKIHKSLVMPYITASDLSCAISQDMHLKQDLINCLQAADIDQAIGWCLLADNLSPLHDQWHVTQLQSWWKRRLAASKDHYMTSDVYLNLLGRFCGPATTIAVYCLFPPRLEVRTEGDGVSVLGQRMTSLVLTPEQVSLLTRNPPRVMLTGPPGTGKSVVLVLAALKWLQKGYDVIIVSMDSWSLAASRMIYRMVKMTAQQDVNKSSAVGQVYLHEFDCANSETDTSKALTTLTTTRRCNELHVICDEFIIDFNQIVRYHQFVADLCQCLPDLCLWVASPFHHQLPVELQEERMTIPLRCPPVVLSEVQRGVKCFVSEIHPYTMGALVSPCDGPHVKHLKHQGRQHSARWPLECYACGRRVARILKQLGVGVTAKHNTRSTTNVVSNACQTSGTARFRPPAQPPSLQYKDVFLLTRSKGVNDDVKDDVGHVTSSANGVVCGLRAADVPVQVVRKPPDDHIDMVTLAWYGTVSGLERKVVVWLPHRVENQDEELSDEEVEARGRIFAMSRCTAFLVLIDVNLS